MFENSAAIDLTVGRSSVRQCILALLMDEAGCRLHLREIQRRVGTSPGTASRELAKLVAAGLVEREAEGNQVYFRASTSPLATMLRSLLVAMPASEFGPRPRRLPRARPAKPAASAEIEAAPATGPAEALVATDATPRVVRLGLWTQNRPEAETQEIANGAAPAHPADPLGLDVAGRLAESMRSIYGEALRGTYLCGARAAGPAPADADIETIIVLDRVESYGAELERTSHICAELSHECKLIVSRIFVAEAVWTGDANGTRSSIRAEAVAV